MEHNQYHHRRYQHPYRQSANLDHFYVITPISNTVRYTRRYELYWKFAEMVRNAGVKLVTVEHALGDRPFMVTQANDPMDIQVRSEEELWFKENLINLGIAHLMKVDPMAKQVAWVDADCFPMYPAVEWFEDTWHALQHYEFVQMWSYLINFGPRNEPISAPQMSFMETYAAAGHKIPEGKNVRHTLAGHSGNIALGRPGLAWAANVASINKVGMLIDKCILGSGDWHMAHALLGAMKQFSGEFSRLSEYSKYLLTWQDRCERWILRDVGVVPATLGHWWHGDKENRQYGSRGQILIRNQYNPYTDVKYDCSGLLQLETYEPRQIRLRDEIREYFKGRHEDSIDQSRRR